MRFSNTHCVELPLLLSIAESHRQMQIRQRPTFVILKSYGNYSKKILEKCMRPSKVYSNIEPPLWLWQVYHNAPMCVS